MSYRAGNAACDAGTRLFGDDAELAADLPARRGRFVWTFA